MRDIRDELLNGPELGHRKLGRLLETRRLLRHHSWIVNHFWKVSEWLRPFFGLRYLSSGTLNPWLNNAAHVFEALSHNGHTLEAFVPIRTTNEGISRAFILWPKSTFSTAVIHMHTCMCIILMKYTNKNNNEELFAK